jgi:hypothetical protein
MIIQIDEGVMRGLLLQFISAEMARLRRVDQPIVDFVEFLKKL